MHLTASGFYPSFRPSECRLRVYLKAHDEHEDEPRRWLGHMKLTTTDTYLNATTRLLHELNERVPLALVKR